MARRAAAHARLSIEIAQVQGDTAAAVEACQRIAQLRGWLPPRVLWPLIALAWRACVEPRQSDALRDLLVESSVHLAQPGPVERACALTSLAERARLGGRPDPQAWGMAAAAWQAMGNAQWSAYALMRQGSACLALGERGAATVALRSAAQLAQQLGAQPLTVQLAAVASRGRVELWPGEGVVASAPPQGLTVREVEVLRLVVEGRSNREIAAALFITVKTASVHVSNILAKLEVPSRGAAAAAARRLGLVSTA